MRIQRNPLLKIRSLIQRLAVRIVAAMLLKDDDKEYVIYGTRVSKVALVDFLLREGGYELQEVGQWQTRVSF